MLRTPVTNKAIGATTNNCNESMTRFLSPISIFANTHDANNTGNT